MAYKKHTWVTRQGVGLNKFTDQNGVKYEFTPSPDEVTQPGTPFSADWMNEMEGQLEKAAVLSGETVEGNFPMFNALGELVNSGKGPDILQYVNGAFSTLGGTSVDVGNAKIETGSYVGTGAPPTLTFSFAPKIVIVLTKGTNSAITTDRENKQHTGLLILTKDTSFKITKNLPYSESGASFVSLLSIGSMKSTIFNDNTVTWTLFTEMAYISTNNYIRDITVTSDSSPNVYATISFCHSNTNYFYIAFA